MNTCPMYRMVRMGEREKGDPMRSDQEAERIERRDMREEVMKNSLVA